MEIRLPKYHVKKGSGKPVSDCIAFAAKHMNLSHGDVAHVMSLFFQEVARQVIQGNIVRVPNFGAFGVKPVYSYKYKRKVPRPIWHSYAGFRVALLQSMQLSDAEAIGTKMRMYTRNANRPGAVSLPMATAHQRFREVISKQMRELGREPRLEEPNDYLRQKAKRENS